MSLKCEINAAESPEISSKTFKFSWRLEDFDENTEKYKTSVSIKGSSILNIELQKFNKFSRFTNKTQFIPKAHQLKYSLKGDEDTGELEVTVIVKVKGVIWSKSQLIRTSSELKGIGELAYSSKQLPFLLEADESTFKLDFELELRRPIATLEVMTPLHDFTLVVGNKNVLVYRLYLAERADSFNDIAKFPEGRVIIDEDISLEAVLEFIRYCYTGGDIQNLETHLKDLLVLSDKFEAHTLKQCCEAQLLMDLRQSSRDNCIDLELFRLGHRHQLKTLSEAAFVKIKQQFHVDFGHELPNNFVDQPNEVANALDIANHAADAAQVARTAQQALLDMFSSTR